MDFAKIDEAVENIEELLRRYPENAQVASVTVIAGVRVGGRMEPAMVFGMDKGDIPTPVPDELIEVQARDSDRKPVVEVFAS